MKSQLTTLMALVGTAAVLAGCSTGSDSAKEKTNNPAPAAAQTLSGGTGCRGDSSPNCEAYQLSENGCDTGPHKFTGPSAAEVHRQFCAALRDDALNKSCAPFLRRDHFEKECQDFTWQPSTPSHPAPVQPAPPASSHPSQPPVTSPDIYAVESALRTVFAERYELAKDLTQDDQGLALRLSNDAVNCGLSSSGLACLTARMNFTERLGITTATEKIQYATEIRPQGEKSPLLFVFELTGAAPLKPVSLTVFKVLKERYGRELSAYLNDGASLKGLSVIDLAPDARAYALAAAHRPLSLRQLYHAIRSLEMDPQLRLPEGSVANLGEEIYLNRRLLFTSSDAIYQKAVFRMAISLLKDSSKQDEIAEGLLASSSEEIKETAATRLLGSHPERRELKPIVMRALGSSDWTQRRSALTALEKTEKTPQEENAILARVGDNDGDVHREAMRVSSTMNLNDTHLPQLKQLLASSEWTTRRDATILVASIASQAATIVLIQTVNDNDGDVRRVAFTSLQHRTLHNEDVPALSALLKSSEWTVRRSSVQLLATIDSKAATTVLIGAMADNDGDVRRAANQALAQRTLTPEFVATLAAQFRSSEWTVRRSVAELLGRIKGDASLRALEDQLVIEQDGDVKRVIISSIKAVRG